VNSYGRYGASHVWVLVGKRRTGPLMTQEAYEGRALDEGGGGDGGGVL